MKTKLLTLLLSVIMILSSCSIDKENTTDNKELTNDLQTAASSIPLPAPSSNTTDTPYYSLSPDEIPAYSGTAYVTLNNNVTGFNNSELTTDAFERYSPLDDLGRCGVAYANVCKETMPTEERGKIGEIKPSGWHTARYDFIDGMYLYNRCHLIAYQLAGENANECNLITGTRYLNIEGMLPFENMTADYVNETGHHVLYRVTPLFVGNNLLALGVQIEAKSVEDNGAGLEFNVFCYNVQPGIDIDYSTGDNRSDGSMEIHTPIPTENPVPSATPTPISGKTSGMTYILNTNTKKFHYPSCSSVKQMKDKNKREFTGTRDEVVAQGYSPCGRCHP